MIRTVYSRALGSLMKKPILLWGISLLYTLIVALVSVFGFIPLIIIPITLVLEAGMTIVFLDGYLRKHIEAAQIFAGFSKKFPHVCGGMLWMSLWIFIWGLIPVVGVFFAIAKTYAYRFTPYILMTRPEISATDALKVSMAETKGHRLSMFGADILIGVIVFVIVVVLVLLGLLPIVGFVFRFILFVAVLAFIAFLPLIYGLVKSAFYAELHGLTMAVEEETPAIEAAVSVCPNCGKPNDLSARFCSSCGTKLFPDEAPPADE